MKCGKFRYELVSYSASGAICSKSNNLNNMLSLFNGCHILCTVKHTQNKTCIKKLQQIN